MKIKRPDGTGLSRVNGTETESDIVTSWSLRGITRIS